MPTAPTSLLLGLQSLTTEELLGLLLRFDLAEPLLRQLKERELTGALANSWPNRDTPSQSPSNDGAMALYRRHHQLRTDDDLKGWCQRHGLRASDLEAEADHGQRREELKARLISGSEESLFLRYKDRLDRVLYRLIRVESEALAQDLFFAIDAGEIRFGEAARQHSQGPEALTEGIVGPVDLSTPHPKISSRLRMAQPGELIPPFPIEQWHTILRLDYRYEATFDDETKGFLQELTLRSVVSDSLEPELEALRDWLTRDQKALTGA